MKNKKYLSVIEKWLHHDHEYGYQELTDLLDISARIVYTTHLKEPWKHFTIVQMEKIAYLLDKDIVEIFWACYKRPYADIAHDEEKVKLNQSLDRAGIK
tara:strand:- start:239 stop:535 length:297 start_codon:yes stop_codon:yes gene_type:complete